ncbi:hypothetical protein O3M35_001349 [Rhynocoris fuscipes]|uniref:Superoxide dismutase [Cu-Zn] n=2 Tax=Rhynocoris fuscipes TaxID=488301 RepID=A0AAW1DTB4_9HEMI
MAIVKLVSPDPKIRGNVTFHQKGKAVAISGVIEGLNEGMHGFHVHEKGDLTSGCASTGSHFNPYNKNHGGPNDADRHVGDLGNIAANSAGVAVISMSDNVIQLDGPNSIIGRAIVVHADQDDLGKGGYTDSLTTGHAGARLACGIIGTLNPKGASSATSIYLTPFLLPLAILINSLH